MTIVTEKKCDDDQPLEAGLYKVKEVVKEVCMKITDLEERVVPTNPLE